MMLFASLRLAASALPQDASDRLYERRNLIYLYSPEFPSRAARSYDFFEFLKNARDFGAEHRFDIWSANEAVIVFGSHRSTIFSNNRINFV
jgi:hypothetical protein